MKRYKKFSSSRDGGFTLIELLVVIIIIGILAGIAVIGVSGARNAAEKTACKADATQLIKAIRAYSAANNLKYPKAPAATDDFAIPSSAYTFTSIGPLTCPTFFTLTKAPCFPYPSPLIL